MLPTTVLVALLVGVTVAQQQLQQSVFQEAGPTARFISQTTPRPINQVPIIRHINRVNQDGSYTFGYESGDGTFRVETRGLDGVIKGKYGYIDDNGQQKEVDYLAGSATGYEPSGQGITVPPRRPPPPPGQEFVDYDDGSWRPPATTPRNRVRVQQQQPSLVHHVQPAPQPRPQPRPQPAALPPQPIHQVEIQRPAVISRPLLQHVPQQQIEPQFHSIPAPVSSGSFGSGSAASFRASPVRQQAISSGSPIELFLNQQLGQGSAGNQQGFRQFS